MGLARLAFLPIALLAVFGMSACGSDGGPADSWEASAIPDSVAPERFADEFLATAMSSWIMAGTTLENQNAYLETGGDSAYVLDLSERIGDDFADALLVPGWRENPELVKFVDRVKHLNAGSLKYWFEASGSRETEGAPDWKRTLSVDGDAIISNVDGAGFRVQAIVIEHANAAANQVGTLDPASLTIDGARTTYELVVVDDGNDLRVTSASVAPVD